MTAVDLRRWEWAAIIALAVIVLVIPASLLKGTARRDSPASEDSVQADFVGRERCISCHQGAYEGWLGSDHDRAMDVAAEETVRGDFSGVNFEHHGITSQFYRQDGKFIVSTVGPDGEIGEFAVSHVFGHEPLQQYLVPFPGGRLQALSLAWDTEREEWFHLYADQDIPHDDWMHWTRNAQNWNGMCAECHSTNLKKNYDWESDTFATTWSEIDVSCEACHGPGSLHVEWAEIQPMARPPIQDFGLVVPTSGISSRQQVELCAPCHSRRGELGDYDHTGLELLDHMLPSLLVEGLYHTDGQILDEVYVYGSFLQSKMYQRDVQCTDCHDAHSLKPRFEDNRLCLQCHRAEAYDTQTHHQHKLVVDGGPSPGASCVKCHMPESLYMGVDWRADHSLRVPRPDLSAELGTPNACGQGGCHADKPLQWSIDAFRRWYGTSRKPHYGRILDGGRRASEDVQGELIRLSENELYPPIVRATALSLLTRQMGEQTDRTVSAALLSDEPLLRHTAARDLTVQDPERRVSLLAPLLLDPVKAVRLAALPALAGVSLDQLKPYQRDAFHEVLAEYEETMKSALDFAASGHNLANLYSGLGRLDEAERYYRKAIEVDDLFFPAKMNLAVLLNQSERNAEAAALLREVLEDY
ncbi:MAG: tetratricopeptide repeat protein, partial [bacterium]|nr:tetratricopeptide repeat protein [bacterium]